MFHITAPLVQTLKIFTMIFIPKHSPYSATGADTGGVPGMHPPTRSKEVLTRHLLSLKIIAKNIFVLHTKS